MPALKRKDDELTLSLSGAPDFNQALAQVRAISGRRFDGDTKLWHFPADPAIAERLMLTLKPTADAALVQWVRNSRAERDAELTTPLPDDAELAIPWADRLFSFQRAAVDFIANHPHMILADDMGLGKAGSVSTPVLTPNGWSTMGALSVGDAVIGSSGQFTLVTGVFPQGVKALYRVTFNDGASTLVCEEHLWAVKTPNDRARAGAWRVKSTKELMQTHDAAGNRRWMIPLVKAVEFAVQPELPLDPYFLGALLGDGSFRGKSTPTFSACLEDARILNLCALPSGDEWHQLSDLVYSVCGGVTFRALKSLGLWGHLSTEKFIPDAYLRAAPEQRLALLQGLMDTDGYNQHGRGYGPSTSAEIAVSSPRLADGIQELVWSLGGTARRRIKPTTHKDSHRITVKLPQSMNPFRLERKAALYCERTKYPLAGRYIESIEYECDDEAVCIRVDAADHLYVTEDYIVTHNTVQALAGVTETILRKDLDAQRPRLIICPNSAKGVWAREIRKWLGDDEPYQLVDASTPKKREQQLIAGISNNAWVVVNYEQIRAKKEVTQEVVKHRDGTTSEREHVEWLLKQPIFTDTDWLAVVADECHRAKNHKSQTARGLWKVSAPVQLGLSGTPLMNHPAELWSVLRWLYPEQYHEQGKRYNGQAWAYWPFYDEYVDDYDSGYGRVIVGVKNPDALRFELRERLVRRTKGQKLDLPPKVREIVPVTLNPKQRKAYEQAESAFWLEIEQAVRDGDQTLAKEVQQVLDGTKRIIELSNGAARTVRLRQVASTPALLGGVDDSAKLDAAVEIITDAPEDKQFVVFTEFVGTANILTERLEKVKVSAKAFTGEVTDTRIRTQYEDEFQNGDIRVLVGTLGAMRESITLTAADTVIFVERSWVPAWNTQAEDRLWRTGQENQVTVLILEAEDTVDQQRVKPTNAVKESIVSAVIHQDFVKEVEHA